MIHKATPSVDKRVVRTKRAIRNAFTELLAEKDINYITIKDIADRANINRKTYYNYYNGIYQLIEEIEKDLVDKFEVTFSEIDMVGALSDPRIIFDRLDDLICADLEFYSNLFTMDENINIISKLTSLIKARTKRSICVQLGMSEDRADVALEFLITGMVAVYQMWFRSNRERPLSEFSDIIGSMCSEGLRGVLKEN